MQGTQNNKCLNTSVLTRRVKLIPMTKFICLTFHFLKNKPLRSDFYQMEKLLN